MSAHNPDQTRSMQSILSNAAGSDTSAVLAARFDVIFRASNRLARLAGMNEEAEASSLADRLAELRSLAPAERDWVVRSLTDIDAMLGSGMAALDTLERRGAPVTAPALALWREVHAARAAIADFVSAVHARTSSPV